MSQRRTIPVVKYHGTGNDFIVVDADAPVPDRVAFATAHCDRDTGIRGSDEIGDYGRDDITDHGRGVSGSRPGADSHRGDRRGADGVLFLALDEDADPIRVEMTLIQPDGSEAAMCGNGARCVARWAHERTGETEFVIETGAGDRGARVHPDEGAVTIEMGRPTFEPSAIPLARASPLVEEQVEGLTVTAVNTGVPHAVAFVDDVDDVDLDRVAPPVRHAAVFPAGANVNLAAPAGTTSLEKPPGAGEPAGGGSRPTDVPVYDQRTYERGVEGETQSCGTGAVAIAAVARHLGHVDGDTVVTRPPGGELILRVPEEGSATLRGPVTREFSDALDPEPNA